MEKNGDTDNREAEKNSTMFASLSRLRLPEALFNVLNFIVHGEEPAHLSGFRSSTNATQVASDLTSNVPEELWLLVASNMGLPDLVEFSMVSSALRGISLPRLFPIIRFNPSCCEGNVQRM